MVILYMICLVYDMLVLYTYVLYAYNNFPLYMINFIVYIIIF